jgi:DNA-binding response OmpR family regulator
MRRATYEMHTDEGIARAGGRKAVLLVEDSWAMQSTLAELIKVMGTLAVACTAMGETQATDWLYNHPQGWDLAVLDLMLDEGSGFALIHRCKTENPGASVVVFSEFATPVLKSHCLEIGADAVFRKSELPQFVRYLEDFGASRTGAAAAA